MNRKFLVTQYAAIFDRENRLLLLRDATGKYIRGKWVFPGGHIGNDRTAEDALAREIMEETGLKLTACWIFKASIKKYPDNTLRLVAYYVCQAKGKIILGKDHDAFDWIDLEKTKKLEFRDDEEKELVINLLKRKEGKKK